MSKPLLIEAVNIATDDPHYKKYKQYQHKKAINKFYKTLKYLSWEIPSEIVNHADAKADIQKLIKSLRTSAVALSKSTVICKQCKQIVTGRKQRKDTKHKYYHKCRICNTDKYCYRMPLKTTHEEFIESVKTNHPELYL